MRTFRAVAFLTVVLSLSCSAHAAELAQLLPKDTDAIISVNLRQVIDSELFKKHALELVKTSLTRSKETQLVLVATGIDPLKDIERITLGMSLENLQQPRLSIFVQGTFDSKKLNAAMEVLAKAEPKQIASEVVEGTTVFKIRMPDQPVPVYAAILDNNWIMVTTEKANLSGTFAGVKGTRKSELKKEMADLLARCDPKVSAFAIAGLKGKSNIIPLPDVDLKKAVEQVEYLAIVMNAANDFTMEVNIGTGSAEVAQQLQALVAAGVEIAKIQLKVIAVQQPELQAIVDLVNSMKAGSRDRTVKVYGRITGESIDKSINPPKK